MIQARRTLAWCAALAAAATITTVAQGPDPEVRARVDAFFNALASGSPERYEAMAREHFSPDFFARRTPDERRQMVERIRGEFGRLTLKGVETRDGETFLLSLSGSTGLQGQVQLTLDKAGPRRIVRIGVTAGDPGGDAADGPPPPVNGRMSADELTKALGDYLGSLSSADRFAGVVLVAKDGTPVYQQAFGLADRERRVANTIATRFNLGSINKIFTKVAIGQLVARGKLTLASTIGECLPDHPNSQARKATVTQLLDHQAGIADFFGPAFAAAPKSGFRSNADYYRFVAPQPLLFEPGAKRQYCNGCYIVLGAIIERVSGMRYEDYVAKHVFEPAAMRGAGFFHADRLPEGVAVGYTRRSPDGGGALRANVQMHGAAGSGAGGAYASAGDLLAFDNALRGQRLLDPKWTAWALDLGQVAAGRATGGLGIAGGAPGVNAVLKSEGAWTVAVVGNLDPPAAERLGVAIHKQLSR